MSYSCHRNDLRQIFGLVNVSGLQAHKFYAKWADAHDLCGALKGARRWRGAQFHRKKFAPEDGECN